MNSSLKLVYLAGGGKLNSSFLASRTIQSVICASGCLSEGFLHTCESMFGSLPELKVQLCISRNTTKLNYNNMLKESNYLSPVCACLEVCTEGILCDSTGTVETPSTESFGKLDEFEW